MADIFLSYARPDKVFVSKIVSILEVGKQSVWWDGNLKGRGKFRPEIQENLANAHIVLVIWTPKSINSPWVTREALIARDSGRLLSLCVAGIKPPIGFKQHQYFEISFDFVDDEVEQQTLVHLCSIAPRSREAPRIIEHRGFVALDFAYRYRIKASTVILWSSVIYIISGMLQILSQGTTDVNLEALALQSTLTIASLILGRFIIPDPLGLLRNRQEVYFERRVIFIWLISLLITIVSQFAVVPKIFAPGNLTLLAIWQLIGQAPNDCCALFIVLCLSLRLANGLGLYGNLERLTLDDSVQRKQKRSAIASAITDIYSIVVNRLINRGER